MKKFIFLTIFFLIASGAKAINAPTNLTATAQDINHSSVLLWTDDPLVMPASFNIFINGLLTYTPNQQATQLVGSQRQFVLQNLPSFSSLILNMQSVDGSANTSPLSDSITITCCPPIQQNVNIISSIPIVISGTVAISIFPTSGFLGVTLQADAVGLAKETGGNLSNIFAQLTTTSNSSSQPVRLTYTPDINNIVGTITLPTNAAMETGGNLSNIFAQLTTSSNVNSQPVRLTYTVDVNVVNEPTVDIHFGTVTSNQGTTPWKEQIFLTGLVPVNNSNPFPVSDTVTNQITNFALESGGNLANIFAQLTSTSSATSSPVRTTYTPDVNIVNTPSVNIHSGVVSANQGTNPWQDNIVLGGMSVSNTNPFPVSATVTNPITNFALESGGNLANIFAQLTTTSNANSQPVRLTYTPDINNISGTISLPTGASTSSLQTTGNTTLSNIFSQLTTTSNANSQPVRLTYTPDINNIGGTITLPTGASTASLQTTGNTSLSNIFAQITTTVNTASQPVRLTYTPDINNIVGTITLPTGASTAANQSLMFGQMTTTANTASQPVRLTYTPGVMQDGVTANAANWFFVVTDTAVSGSLTTLGAITVTANRMAALTAQVGGTAAGLNISFQGSNDNFTTTSNLTTFDRGNIFNDVTGAITANGSYQVLPVGFAKVRALVTAITSGFVSVTINVSAAPAVVAAVSKNSANFQAQVQGNVASGSSDSGNPLKIGGVASVASLPTKVSDGQRINAQFDGIGRQVQILNGTRENMTKTTKTLATTTETVILPAAGVGFFWDIIGLVLANNGVGPETATLRDATGATGNEASVFVLGNNTTLTVPLGGSPLIQTTANNPWTIQMSSAVPNTSITLIAVKSQ